MQAARYASYKQPVYAAAGESFLYLELAVVLTFCKSLPKLGVSDNMLLAIKSLHGDLTSEHFEVLMTDQMNSWQLE